MGKTIIRNAQTTLHVEGSNRTIIVTDKGRVTAAEPFNDAIFDDIEASGNKYTINGTLRSLVDDGYGLDVRSDGAKVIIGKGGSITGNYGIAAYGEEFSIENHGNITGDSTGIYISDGKRFENHGTISGDYGATIEGGICINAKDGKIIGDGVAFGTNGDTRFTNFGIVKSLEERWSYLGDDSADYLINKGRMIGDVDLAQGADFMDARGGTVKGVIHGGTGSDTLITDKASVKLLEDVGGLDRDTVKSTVSYTLNDGIEFLELLGKKNINGTGSSAAGENFLYGNSGNNVLRGLGLVGTTDYYGGKGDDTYIGVDGVQDLYSLRKGGGHDTVKTYVDGEDVIDLYGFMGFDYDTPFSTLQAHFKEKNGDTWIDMGKGDVIILKDIDSDVLDESDFLFNY